MKTEWHLKDEYPVERKGIIMYCNGLDDDEDRLAYEVSPDTKEDFDWLMEFHHCAKWCYEDELLSEIAHKGS